MDGPRIYECLLNRMKFLTLSRGDSTDQWVSTSRGVRRLADRSRDERLFDSDFTVEDFAAPTPEAYSLTEHEDQRVHGELCHVIDVVPDAVQADYARRRVFVSREDRLLVRAEYYAQDGEVVRLFELDERIRVDGKTFPGRVTMRTLTEQTYTVLTVEEIEADVAIPQRIFSRGNL